MTQSNAKRETFSGRKAFIMAAIGSAVGLGNIWRFPYTTYENGGGAFIIPYLIALLTAGIPLLFLDYAIGHRHRGGAPLSYRRFNPHFEVVWLVAGDGQCYYRALLCSGIRLGGKLYLFSHLILRGVISRLISSYMNF